jgi:hypothetical protein
MQISTYRRLTLTVDWLREHCGTQIPDGATIHNCLPMGDAVLIDLLLPSKPDKKRDGERIAAAAGSQS